jgi:hypothetical protein
MQRALPSMGGQLSFETFSSLFFLDQALVLLFFEHIKKKKWSLKLTLNIESQSMSSQKERNTGVKNGVAA